MTYQEFISQFEVYDSYNKAKAKGFEAHHIVPRALQKSNENFDDRCIRVTAYQHFLAHYLLALENEDAVIVLYKMVNRNKVKLSDVEKVTLEDLEYWASLREQGRKKHSETLKGVPQSDETKKKKSKAHKGVPLSEEHCKHISEARKGIPRSEECCRNISKALKGKPSPMKGTIYITDGIKNKRISKDIPIPEGFVRGRKPSASRKGKKHSEEWNKNIGESNRGKVRTEEQRQHLSAAKRGQIPWNKGKKGVQVAWNKGIQMSEAQKQSLQQRKYEYHHNNPLGLTWNEFSREYSKQKKA